MPPNKPQAPAVPAGHVPVTLSIRPGEVTHVPEDEVPILRQQGLLVEDQPAATAGGKEAS